MGWTNPRILKNAVVAIAHQTAFGSAASSSGALAKAQASESELSRGTVLIDPQGTTGSEFPRDTMYEVGTAPTAKLRFYAASNAFLAAILEHATHGQPTSVQGSGDLSSAGDTNSYLSSWSLTGIRPGFNAEAATYKIYVKYQGETPGAGSGTVSLYSDSARTALVAQGNGAYNGSATLAAQNNSGLSGTVTLAAAATVSNLTGIVLTINRVRPQRAATIARWFTLFRDTGNELEQLQDCTVASLRFASQERGPLEVEVEIVGSTYAIGATVLTTSVATADLRYFVHPKVTLTVNSVTDSALSLIHGVKHEIGGELANSAVRVAVWKRYSQIIPIEFAMRLSDEARTIRDLGPAQTWTSMTADYLYGSKHLVCTYSRVWVTSVDLPATKEKEWADFGVKLEGRDDGTNAPAAFTLDL